MNKYRTRLAIACIAFVIAAVAGSLRRATEEHWKLKESQAPHAQTVPTETPTPAVVEDKLKSLSPFDIEWFINAHPQANLAELWQRLEIHAAGEHPANDRFLEDCNSCEARTFRYNFDEDSDAEVLLRIEDRLAESCRYLLFKQTDRFDSWKLIGRIDSDFGRYRMPTHSILLCDGRAWLIVTMQGASGSGVALYFDRLFLVEQGILREVMSYNSEGHQADFGYEPERNFSARIIDCKLRNRIASIEIEFVVSYANELDSNPRQPDLLFTKRQRAFFVRPLSGNESRLENHSELLENELEDVYSIDSLTNEEFLKYNFKELSQFAIGTDASKREWLRRFLNVCESTKDKARLQSLLR